MALSWSLLIWLVGWRTLPISVRCFRQVLISDWLGRLFWHFFQNNGNFTRGALTWTHGSLLLSALLFHCIHDNPHQCISSGPPVVGLHKQIICLFSRSKQTRTHCFGLCHCGNPSPFFSRCGCQTERDDADQLIGSNGYAHILIISRFQYVSRVGIAVLNI